MLSRSCHAVLLLAATTFCALALNVAVAGAINPTSSTITTPSGTIYPLANPSEEGPAITIAGTAESLSEVEIRCYYSSGAEGFYPLASKVAVKEGAFQATVLRSSFETRLCRLRAVPVGEKSSLPPSEEGPNYRGPLAAPSNFDIKTNTYNATSNSLGGYLYVQGAEGCGLESRLVLSILQESNYLFYCNGGIVDQAGNPEAGTRVDNAIAYGPRAGGEVEAALKVSIPGAPHTTITGKSFDETNGNMTISERDPFVKCSPEPEVDPATSKSCSSFVSTGVTFERAWTLGATDHIATMHDTWRSSDGAAHTVATHYFNEWRQTNEPAETGTFEFPGTSSFAGTTTAETIGLPAGPGTILYKSNGTTPDAGDGTNPQGALVYDRAPSGPLKVTEPTSKEETYDVYEAPYTLSIPAGGTSDVRITYIQGFGLPEVRASAEAAMAGYAPTVAIAAPANGGTVESESVSVTGTAADSGALAGVSVNGVAATLGAGGAWSASVPLKAGANTITATATDQAGLSKSAAITVTYKIPPGKATLLGAITSNKGNVSFTLKCAGPAGSTCTVKDTLTTVEKRKGSKIIGLLARIKKKTLTVASGSQTIPAGKSAKVTLKLNTTGKTLLKRFHKLPAKLTVTISTTAKPTTVTARNLTITPPKHKRKH